MSKRLYIIHLLLILSVVLFAKKRDVHILAVNDMHSAIDNMPRLIGLADSLRNLYPSLLVFSAGDNRTGNPINDKYTPSGYPMVALMNLAGFNATAVGNHEFDANSLARLCELSSFSYLCANMTAEDSTGIKTLPYKIFDVEGLKIGVVGLVQTNWYGIPDAHPAVLKGLHFTSPFETVRQYKWMPEQCDATILLSHVGYHGDLMIADKNPWIDLIIGGHTHRQLGEKEPLRNGVLITQNRHLLGRAVHITLTVDSGRVTDKKADYFNLQTFNSPNKPAEALVQHFNDAPFFKRKLTLATAPFSSRNEIGAMVCDALMEQTGADIAIMNYRGIRITRMDAGDICIKDAYEIDPYGSHVVLATMKGDELEDFIISYSRMNVYKFPHLGGLRADITLKKKGDNDIKKVKLLTTDGRKFNRKKTYKVVTNTYVLATSHKKFGEPDVQNTTTTDVIINFLERQDSINYQGKGQLHYISPE